MSIPLNIGMQLWRQRFGLDEARAAKLLSTMPYNIERAESGTLIWAREKALTARLIHVSSTMSRCRCVIGQVRAKP